MISPNFLPLLAGLLLCPIVATNSCKQSKSKIGFCVVQLWPTFNRFNFESVSTNPFLAWFIPAACWVSLFLRWPNPVLDSAAFGKSVESAISATCWGCHSPLVVKNRLRIFPQSKHFSSSWEFNNGVLLRAAVYPISITKRIDHYEKSKE